VSDVLIDDPMLTSARSDRRVGELPCRQG
jgi:hypothetical protein